MRLKILSGLFSLVAQYFDVFTDEEAGAGAMYQLREDKRAKRINPPYRLYTHRNPSKNIFRSSLTSVVPKRVNVDRWAKAHAMLPDVRANQLI